MRGTYRLRYYAKRLRSYIARNSLVLLYHRVADLDTDPFSLSVTPDNFSEQMKVLRKVCNPISLRELSEGLRNQRIKRRSVVVSFDDGYADNFHNAKPILERYEIPAVVFVIAGAVGVQNEFWWDELERILLQPGSLPEELRFRLNGTETRWRLGQSAVEYSENSYREHGAWYFGKDVPTERHALYVDLYKVIRPLAPHQQNEMLEMLRAWSGQRTAAAKSSLPMTPSELRALRRGDLIEVGAHTMSHPVLSTLPEDSQRREIHQSKNLLQEFIGERITGFAYPYGGEADYTRETANI